MVFWPGSLVLRRVFENTIEVRVGKLQANWERPYVVIKARDSGTYYLQTLDNVPMLHPWNVTNLSNIINKSCL